MLCGGGGGGVQTSMLLPCRVGRYVVIGVWLCAGRCEVMMMMCGSCNVVVVVLR